MRIFVYCALGRSAAGPAFMFGTIRADSTGDAEVAVVGEFSKARPGVHLEHIHVEDKTDEMIEAVRELGQGAAL